jgi:hypothetical protein
MILDIDLIFGIRVYNHKLQINFEIHLLFLAYYRGFKSIKKKLHSNDSPDLGIELGNQ